MTSGNQNMSRGEISHLCSNLILLTVVSLILAKLQVHLMLIISLFEIIWLYKKKSWIVQTLFQANI
jgi:hypothetical protein